MINDWYQDEVTDAVLALLPEWARWLGERACLPEPFMRQVLDAAQETPQSAAAH